MYMLTWMPHFQSNYTEQLNLRLKVVKKEINYILRQRSEFFMHRTRQHYYFHGSTRSHLLAMKIHANEQFADILSIRTQQGEMTTDAKRVKYESIMGCCR